MITWGNYLDRQFLVCLDILLFFFKCVFGQILLTRTVITLATPIMSVSITGL